MGKKIKTEENKNREKGAKKEQKENIQKERKQREKGT
jgi:hypothetical protein